MPSQAPRRYPGRYTGNSRRSTRYPGRHLHRKGHLLSWNATGKTCLPSRQGGSHQGVSAAPLIAALTDDHCRHRRRCPWPGTGAALCAIFASVRTVPVLPWIRSGWETSLGWRHATTGKGCGPGQGPGNDFHGAVLDARRPFIRASSAGLSHRRNWMPQASAMARDLALKEPSCHEVRQGKPCTRG